MVYRGAALTTPRNRYLVRVTIFIKICRVKLILIGSSTWQPLTVKLLNYLDVFIHDYIGELVAIGGGQLGAAP